MRIDIINLGCSKNLVDSEKLMSQLFSQGIKTRLDPHRINADVLIINTCGFIHDAREESVNTMLDAIEAKKNGRISRIFAMGCLVQRYRNELVSEMPEIDAWYGVDQIPEVISDLKLTFNPEILNHRHATTPRHYAYLKISEGCSRKCSFCAIPAIRGRHISRSLEDITEEAAYLVGQGARELILIAQDLSFYGRDLYGRSRLAELLERLEQIEGLSWIRLHYAYPLDFPVEILDQMAASAKICHYLDIPFQHVSDRMLKMMKRGVNREDTLNLIRLIRKKVPGISLRTTLLVGHPGETERDFAELVEFVENERFDRLGVFTYSPEEGTLSGDIYPDDVPEEIKQSRYSTIMEIQQDISASQNREKIGNRIEVIIDRKEEVFYVGRSQYDSPEVDQEILIRSDYKILKTGHFYTVEITDSDDYDMYASYSTERSHVSDVSIKPPKPETPYLKS